METQVSVLKTWLDGVPVGMLPQTYRAYREELDRPQQESKTPKRLPRDNGSLFPPRMLKTNDAAAYLGISPWKLRNLVQSGEIRYIPGDGTSPWLFDKQDLDSWIETRKQRL